jgi:hypothetical protein
MVKIKPMTAEISIHSNNADQCPSRWPIPDQWPVKVVQFHHGSA